MTQIISVLTQDYVLLVSDRRLTYANGPKKGQIFDDDTCKLVSLCNIAGIGYTGLAHISGQPTHEWIAKTLASHNCQHPSTASEVIIDKGNQAFKKIEESIRYQSFLIAGWADFEGMSGIRPHFCTITNMLDDYGNRLALPKDKFDRRVKALPHEQKFLWTSVGQPISKVRQEILEKNISKLVKNKISPKETLRLMSEEIIYTSTNEKNATVGNKILGFCIPKNSVETQVKSGHSLLLAKQPDLNTASFTYFENGYIELEQFGPTFICGENAMTDIRTENDPARNFQSSQVKILSFPKSNTLTN